MADNNTNSKPASVPKAESNSTSNTRNESSSKSNTNGEPSLERSNRGEQKKTGQRGGRNNRGRDGGRGGRGGRGSGRGGRGNDRGGRGRKSDMGRGEWSRTYVDKRQRNNEEQAAKRQRLEENGEDPESALPFTQEEIASEERKPKKKVAVLVGYAGTGYKGMQINALEKTIEGDLFTAFVAAGAISKANADDPKKSSLVRCARTDKGVHAAGNVISLKLIVEDADIVAKINENLPAQIRVWGIERTNGAFSCYQACDSRWYEYLIPTYSFIPPHPQSFLGKKLVESSEQEGIHETYQARQADVADFWKNAEEEYVKPILDKLTPELKAAVMVAVHTAERDFLQIRDGRDWEKDEVPGKSGPDDIKDDLKPEKSEEAKVEETTSNPALKRKLGSDTDLESDLQGSKDQGQREESPPKKAKQQNDTQDQQATEEAPTVEKPPPTPLDLAIKEVKAAYVAAKKAYRISEVRRKAVQDALNSYIGTINFYNYTIQKTYRDPSAKRVIRSFKVGTEPIIINDTEWLSLKVHGQSFMMHQIRKMVAMVALVVRCGTGLERMKESFGPDKISIPKAPGLGLLLERPVFDSYNSKAVNEFAKEKLDFGKYEKAIEEFKQKEIYERIFRVENEKHEFHSFFHHLDNFHAGSFLWVTAGGVRAMKQFAETDKVDKGVEMADVDSDDEDRKQGVEEG